MAIAICLRLLEACFFHAVAINGLACELWSPESVWLLLGESESELDFFLPLQPVDKSKTVNAKQMGSERSLTENRRVIEVSFLNAGVIGGPMINRLPNLK